MAQEDVSASERGNVLCRAIDDRYKTCKDQIGEFAQDDCTAYAHLGHPKNSLCGSTFGNVSSIDSLSSLLLLDSFLLGLQLDALIDSGATNNFLSQACFEWLAAK